MARFPCKTQRFWWGQAPDSPTPHLVVPTAPTGPETLTNLSTAPTASKSRIKIALMTYIYIYIYYTYIYIYILYICIYIYICIHTYMYICIDLVICSSKTLVNTLVDSSGAVACKNCLPSFISELWRPRDTEKASWSQLAPRISFIMIQATAFSATSTNDSIVP